MFNNQVKYNNKLLSIKAYHKLIPIFLEENLIKEYIFYSVLKSKHVSATYFDTNQLKGIQYISKIYGCSNSTTRRYIKKLTQLGWITEDKNKNHIRLTSIYKIATQYGIEHNELSARIVPYVGKQTKEVILSLFISKNLEQQHHVLSDKIGSVGKSYQKLFNANPEEGIKALNGERNEKVLKLNCDVTVSRQSISNLTGYQSKTSASRLINVLGTVGMIKSDYKREITLMENVSSEAYRNHPYGTNVYRTKNGKLVMRIPNKVVLNDCSVIYDLINLVNASSKKGCTISFDYNKTIQANLDAHLGNLKMNTQLGRKGYDSFLSKGRKGSDGSKVLDIISIAYSRMMIN